MWSEAVVDYDDKEGEENEVDGRSDGRAVSRVSTLASKMPEESLRLRRWRGRLYLFDCVGSDMALQLQVLCMNLLSSMVSTTFDKKLE